MKEGTFKNIPPSHNWAYMPLSVVFILSIEVKKKFRSLEQVKLLKRELTLKVEYQYKLNNGEK